MKKKILVLAMCLSIVGAVTGCGDDKKKEKEKVDSKTTTEAVVNNDDTTVADTTTEAASDSEEEAEGTGTCWIMEQDLSLATVASPSDAIYMDVRAGVIDSADVVELPIRADYFNRFTYVGVSNEQYASVEEALLSDACQKMVKPGKEAKTIGYGPTTELCEHDYIPTYGNITVMNPAEQEVTYAQCVENGWFYEENGFGNLLSTGNTKEIGDFNQDGDTDDKDTLAYYVSVWGAPTYFDTYDVTNFDLKGDDVVEWFVQENDYSITYYYIAWEFDEYVIKFYIMDSCLYNRFEISGSSYYSRALWDELDNYNGLPYLKELTGK